MIRPRLPALAVAASGPTRHAQAGPVLSFDAPSDSIAGVGRPSAPGLFASQVAGGPQVAASTRP